MNHRGHREKQRAQRLNQVIDILDGLAKKFDIMLIEQRAISATLSVHSVDTFTRWHVFYE